MFPFGEHRARIGIDLLDGNARSLRDLLERFPASNPGLNLARRQCAFHSPVSLMSSCLLDARTRPILAR